MEEQFRESLKAELGEIEAAGLFKRERILESAQGNRISVKGRSVLNFCANNYLGLAGDERLRVAAKRTIDEFGVGLASVRFICGTQSIHKNLEKQLSSFLGMEDTILYSSCFDANAGLFETILGENDAVISDALNHASIIDGIRLSKAKRFRYAHSDMNDLRRCLTEARAANPRRILVTTDGAFSMDGEVAKLQEVCALAEEFGALVHVDDSHATGVIGATGRGSIEECQVQGRVSIVTSTLGKALGGSAGGFTSASVECVDYLRQRSRPYLFSNTVAPAIVGAATECLSLLQENSVLCETLQKNTKYFRSQIQEMGFTIKGVTHPIVPVMLGDARLASQMADLLLEEGIYVIGFSFPVVPKGEARIRVQISAAHTPDDLDHALTSFEKIGKDLGVI